MKKILFVIISILVFSTVMLGEDEKGKTNTTRITSDHQITVRY
ncbi:hypothetical protein [Marinitoga sp. 38H-ov]|nr:hypothetical protein [Marinitoga sp. 38H-ov]